MKRGRIFRPGNARQRWETATSFEAALFGAGALFVTGFVGGPGKWPLVGFLVLMAILAVRDSKRGWKIRYDLPPPGKRAIERGSKIAAQAWEDTQREARNPNRKRYAFQKKSKLRRSNLR